MARYDDGLPILLEDFGKGSKAVRIGYGRFILILVICLLLVLLQPFGLIPLLEDGDVTLYGETPLGNRPPVSIVAL